MLRKFEVNAVSEILSIVVVLDKNYRRATGSGSTKPHPKPQSQIMMTGYFKISITAFNRKILPHTSDVGQLSASDLSKPKIHRSIHNEWIHRWSMQIGLIPALHPEQLINPSIPLKTESVCFLTYVTCSLDTISYKCSIIN